MLLGLVLAGFLCALLGMLMIAVRSYRAEAGLFARQRRSVPLADGAAILQGLQAVEFGADPVLRGWYVPSRNRAAVVLTHGTGSDRRSLLRDAELLSSAGFGVLLFDFPGHGASDGTITWGETERTALAEALTFLGRQPDLDAGRIGLAGFSLGGAIALEVAADDTRVAALAVLGTPSDVRQQTHWEYRRWGALSIQPALWALQRHGLDLDRPQPRQLIVRLAPRPVLIVNGSEDSVVPPFMARDLYTAARQPKHWFIVRGAGHGDYLAKDAQGYTQALVSFFERGLLGDRQP